MSKKVGILRAILRLDGAKFDKDVKRQKSKIARFAAFAKRVFAPLAAAAAAIGSARAVKGTLDTVDAQAKLARSLGTTVESMQVLARAGELAGVGQAQLEQGSKDLFRRLSQAASGSGAAAKALERLKLNSSDLLKLPLDERIAKINGAIAEFIPKAEQAAVAGALFGEEGSIAMTRLDPATLAQAAEEVAKFGRVISDVEAAKIEQANDAMSRLGLVARGIGTDLTIALAPALEAASKTLASWTPTIRAILNGIRDAFSVLQSFVTYIFSSGSAVSNSLSSMATGFWDVVKRLWSGIGRILSGLRALIQQAGSFDVVVSHLKAIASEVGERIGLIFRSMGLKVRGTFQLIAGHAIRSLGEILRSAMSWAARMADIAIGSKDAMVAAFRALPNALGSLMYEAANATIRGVEALVNGVVKRINAFITTINNAIAQLPEWARGDFAGISAVSEVSFGGVENPFSGSDSVGTAARDAFSAAQGQSNFGTGGSRLFELSAGILGRGSGNRAAGAILAEYARAPLSALEELRQAMDAAREAEAEALAETEDLGAGLDDLGGSANTAANSLDGGSASGGLSAAAKAAVEKLKTLREGVKGVADELAGAILQGRSWGEVLSNALKKVAQTWLSQGIETILLKMSGLGGGGGGNLFGRILGGLFGARAMGGGVRAGQIYQVNENTPRSEWLFASGNGGVLNHGQMTSAVRQALGGGNSQQAPGLMRIMLGDGLKAEFLNDAAAQSAEITRMGIEGNNSAVRQAQRRG
ncbi:hypothetical protein AAFO90_17030 [Phaeobacter sp. CAU 1743]|uniref:hypothetical protein n=1 Tax=Phaeobacter sp. CAU 1743 TaxID=3140367 RepID=UPI00325C22B6